MAQHILGISGSTILSNPKEYPNLFNNREIAHIEIGEFPDQEAFASFLEEYQKHEVTFGLHSPLYRNQSKYDLLEKVHVEPEEAWANFEKEMADLSKIGAEYILVHFPYFKEEKERDTNEEIEEGLKKLQALQEKYELLIVCEPKLGQNRSAVAIEALNDFSVDTWEKYGIKLCIDVGDYLMAAGSKASEYIKKWKPHIRVVHLHNVEFDEKQYIWVPVHPSQEKSSSYYSVRDLILQLAESTEVYFVFEHTPHSKPTETFVNEGIEWVRELLHSSTR